MRGAILDRHTNVEWHAGGGSRGAAGTCIDVIVLAPRTYQVHQHLNTGIVLHASHTTNLFRLRQSRASNTDPHLSFGEKDQSDSSFE